MALKQPPTAVMTWELVLFFLFTAMLAAIIDRRLFASAFFYLLAFCTAVVWPEWIFEAVAFGNLFGCLAIAHYWKPSAAPERAGPKPPERRLKGA